MSISYEYRSAILSGFVRNLSQSTNDKNGRQKVSFQIHNTDRNMDMQNFWITAYFDLKDFDHYFELINHSLQNRTKLYFHCYIVTQTFYNLLFLSPDDKMVAMHFLSTFRINLNDDLIY